MAKADLSWGVEKRLEFMEFRLYWEGQINRSDLIREFGISIPQASLDIREYMSLAEGNMVYDHSRKRYIANPDFKPVLITPSAESYLLQLSASGQTGLTGPNFIGTPPPFDQLAMPARRVEAETLRRILAAIRNGEALEIHYQSMSSPEPAWRWITPHALGTDGTRWHVRAYCHKDNTFKDFVLARFLDIRASKPAEIEPRSDREWHQWVAVTLAPNPELSEGQKRTIERDYGMEKGMIRVLLRQAFLFYLKQKLGVPETGEAAASRPAAPQSQQLVLLGVEETSAPVGKYTGESHYQELWGRFG